VTFLANEHKEMEREIEKGKYKDKKKGGSMTRTWGLLLMMVFFPFTTQSHIPKTQMPPLRFKSSKNVRITQTE